MEPLNEPVSLKRQTDDIHTFRFIWIRTFHYPFIFTLHIKKDTSGILEVKEGNKIVCCPDSLIFNKIIDINKSKVSDWKKKLNGLSFWNYNPTSKMIEDGAQWILEGSKDTNYHIVNIKSPDSGLYRDVCLDLMKMAGVELGPIY